MAYKQVTATTLVGDAVANAYSELQALRDEMREKAEALGEKFSGTEKYQTCNDTADTLDGFCDEEVDVPAEFADIEIQVTSSVNRSKKRAASRATRCGNACAELSAVIDRIEERKTELEADEDRGKVGDQLLDELEELREKLQEAVDNAEGLDFPGMY